MKILILEDEPIIAIDLEEIVIDQIGTAKVLVADCIESALSSLDEGIDFALLDIALGGEGETSLPIARRLMLDRVPFCFVSSSLDDLPSMFGTVPQVPKPFRPEQVAEILPQTVA